MCQKEKSNLTAKTVKRTFSDGERARFIVLKNVEQNTLVGELARKQENLLNAILAVKNYGVRASCLKSIKFSSAIKSVRLFIKRKSLTILGKQARTTTLGRAMKLVTMFFISGLEGIREQQRSVVSAVQKIVLFGLIKVSSIKEASMIGLSYAKNVILSMTRRMVGEKQKRSFQITNYIAAV